MALPSFICSIDGCKRAVACLCRHCQKDVCVKHFNEHQIEVNNGLIPITDRLNELKMKLQIDGRTDRLAQFQTWREKKYHQIDKEYHFKVEDFKQKISKHDAEISQAISNIRDLIDEGDASMDQVQQIKKTVETLTDQVNKLMSTETTNTPNLVDTYVRMGKFRYLIKARIKCGGTEMYAMESEKPLPGYDGLCSKCNQCHVLLNENRGFYALCERIHDEN